MNKLSRISIGVLIFLINLPAWSDSPEDHACQDVFVACQKAGYLEHGPPGKDFGKDCLAPMLTPPYTKVSGVDVSDEQIAACQKNISTYTTH